MSKLRKPRTPRSGTRVIEQSITSRELSTILAALRCWQADIEASPCEVSELRPLLALYFKHVTPLRTEEIDTLCENMCAGVWQVIPNG